jgi:hypothetical protein
LGAVTVWAREEETKGMAVQVRWARRRRMGSEVEMEKGEGALIGERKEEGLRVRAGSDAAEVG